VHSNWSSLPVSVCSQCDSYTADDRDNKFKRLFYASVQALKMDLFSPKRVGFAILQHDYNSNTVCAFAGLHCKNRII